MFTLIYNKIVVFAFLASNKVISSIVINRLLPPYYAYMNCEKK